MINFVKIVLLVVSCFLTTFIQASDSDVKGIQEDGNFPLELKVLISPEEGFMNDGWGSIVFDLKSVSSESVIIKTVECKWIANGDTYHSFVEKMNIKVPANSNIKKSIIVWMPKQSELLLKENNPLLSGIIKLDNGKSKSFSVEIPISKLPSPTVLKKGEKVGLELQRTTWDKIENPEKIVKYLDNIYRQMVELTGNIPYNGELLVLKESPRNPFFAYAGNPIILNTSFVMNSAKSFDNDVVDFGWVHEMGHDFDDNIGSWYNEGTFTEFQANIKLSFVIEKLCTDNSLLKIRSLVDKKTLLDGRSFNDEYFIPYGERYLSSNRTYDTMSSDEYHALFLKVIRDKGWKVMKEFYKIYGKLAHSGIELPPRHEKVFLALAVLDYVSGIDLAPLYNQWRIPLSRTMLDALIVKYQLGDIPSIKKNKALVSKKGINDRKYWINEMDKMCRPVLYNMSIDKLKENMPNERDLAMSEDYSFGCAHLEALGRTLAGIAPWLELGPDDTEEGKLRGKYIDWSLKSISNAVNPQASDYLNFNKGTQPLVDAAFLCQALLRAPKQLWGNLDERTKNNLINELKSTRVIKPWPNNWLLFSAMIEATLLELTGDYDIEPIRYAVNKMEEWYVGDAMYGDGSRFHNDYYNSYVIHPMLMSILEVMSKHEISEFDSAYKKEQKRFARYATQLERMIMPDGTYPVIGRSIVYRFGAFHSLADAALRHQLPKRLFPSQVRSALTAVIKKQMDNNLNYDDNGWLLRGFMGHQSRLGEVYISTGSLYLATFVFLPLGLSADDDFWTEKYTDWTNKQIWNGEINVNIDSALYD